MNVPWLARQAMLLALVPLTALGLVSCGPQAAPPVTSAATTGIEVQNVDSTAASASTASPAAPTPTAPPTPTVLAVPQQIFIDSPPPGTLVGSPMQLAGRTARMPSGGQIDYQVLNGSSQVIGTGRVPVRASSVGGGIFDAPLTFTLPQDGGATTAQLFERAADGSIVAVTGLDLFVQSQSQSITIDTPPPGTQVGSPVVLTGRLARLPNQGRLNYIVTNSRQQQIGAGAFDVAGESGRPASYVGSLTFDLPFDGDTIAVQLYDQDPANGATIAPQSISLYVAPAQQILIDTPPAGTLIGSPVVVTGRTVRFPFNGTLNYRFADAGDAQLGAGTFAVVGDATSGAQFNAQATLNLPRDGGLVRLTISDQDPSTGAVRASSTLDLDVRAQYPGISIDTPSSGTQVGSPVVLTGSTNWYPNTGQLRYRVLNDSGAEIGSGALQVAGAPGGRGSFNASLTFAEPPNGGNIRIELTDQSDGGNVVAKAEIPLAVAPLPPPQIIIDTPPPGTQVGSPVVLTGRVTYIPANGQLTYRVRDQAGTIIGQGNVPAIAGGRQARFNASLTFAEPAQGGNIVVEMTAPSPGAGAAPITAPITLYVAPKM